MLWFGPGTALTVPLPRERVHGHEADNDADKTAVMGSLRGGGQAGPQPAPLDRLLTGQRSA